MLITHLLTLALALCASPVLCQELPGAHRPASNGGGRGGATGGNWAPPPAYGANPNGANNHGNHLTPTHQRRIADNYIAIWHGDLSLVNATFMPELTLAIDRFPVAGGGSADYTPYITTADAFAGFVNKTRTGLREYRVVPQNVAAQGPLVFIRWTLEIVMGEGFSAVPTTLKPGDKVAYNGTEFLQLDPNTGLINHVASAQDLITFMYNLGNDVSLVPRKSA